MLPHSKMKMCQAGRRCGFGGRWIIPCLNEAIHAIANSASPPILLCDEHFQEVAAAGKVVDENIITWKMTT